MNGNDPMFIQDEMVVLERIWNLITVLFTEIKTKMCEFAELWTSWPKYLKIQSKHNFN